MSEHRTSAIGSILQRIEERIEEHLEESRERERARETEAMTNREKLWAEAAQRQKLLAEAIADEEAERSSFEEITKQHHIAFVLHREDLSGALETFASEKACLVRTVPGKGDYGSGKGIEGIKGSWLVFETQE